MSEKNFKSRTNWRKEKKRELGEEMRREENLEEEEEVCEDVDLN